MTQVQGFIVQTPPEERVDIPRAGVEEVPSLDAKGLERDLEKPVEVSQGARLVW